jgi:hypothetical protein
MKRPMAPRRYWTAAELRKLRRKFPTTKTADLARELGRHPSCVSHKAYSLGLSKAPEYMADALRSGRTNGQRGLTTRFKAGQTPWNKGRKGWQAGGRAATTQFKPGRPAHESRNYVPIGTYRINHEGYLEQKTTDDRSLAPARRWVGVHRLVWEAVHGPVPAGHAVVFRPGRRTAELERITADGLELVTRAELMRRNTHHNLPPEVSQLIQLRGALNRKIRNRTKTNDAEPNAERA